MKAKDNEILSLLKKHDEHGIRLMFDMYSKVLVIYSVKIVSILEVGEDIVQDFYIRFWEERKYLDISGSLKSYLFISIRNSSLDYLKANAKIQNGPIEEYADKFPYEEYDNSEMEKKRKQLYAEIEKLSPQSKRVFEAIVLKDLKYKEVAEVLGISTNTVKTLFSRSLKKLRNSLDIIIIVLLA